MAGDGMDILQGYWKGWEFLHGFLNVGSIFEWVLAGGEFQLGTAMACRGLGRGYRRKEGIFPCRGVGKGDPYKVPCQLSPCSVVKNRCRDFLRTQKGTFVTWPSKTATHSPPCSKGVAIFSKFSFSTRFLLLEG